MLSLPKGEGTVEEGLSDEKPIVLKGVKSVDFARLLWSFYRP
jgi:hypothetical protein